MAEQLIVPKTSTADLIGLGRLAAVTEGRAEVVIGLLDGPVAEHPDFAGDHIRAPWLADATGAAAAHGTHVAGILLARRGATAPAICPGCTLLSRPIFTGAATTTTAADLADGIIDCVRAGAHVLNISAALTGLTPVGARRLAESLDFAMHAGVLVVAAAGNGGQVGGSALTRHPWVIPVVAYDGAAPLPGSDVSASIGRRGLGAPGSAVVSLAPGGDYASSSGTSTACPFVTGTVALLLSSLPGATGAGVRSALINAGVARRRGVIPPLLDAWRAYRLLAGER
jgi:subtilisin family serine protease